MHFNFELILFFAVLISGLIALFDLIFFAKKRRIAYAAKIKNINNPPEIKLPVIVEYARSFFPVLLVVFFLRSFLYEPFRIPSGSLEPTLLVGDFVLVNKYDYGVRLPVSHNKIFQNHEPKRGDIFVFRFPPNPKINIIKRVIGVPGDHIRYTDKTLYINDKEVPQTLKETTTRIDEEGNTQSVLLKEENLFGVKHTIYQNPNVASDDFAGIVVPDGMYFAMGDNRDDSADSRYWGFVPESNIVGNAVLTWMSWDSKDYKIRWNRLIKQIH
jgi:signal peptidase I